MYFHIYINIYIYIYAHNFQTKRFAVLNINPTLTWPFPVHAKKHKPGLCRLLGTYRHPRWQDHRRIGTTRRALNLAAELWRPWETSVLYRLMQRKEKLVWQTYGSWIFCQSLWIHLPLLYVDVCHVFFSIWQTYDNLSVIQKCVKLNETPIRNIFQMGWNHQLEQHQQTQSKRIFRLQQYWQHFRQFSATLWQNPDDSPQTQKVERMKIPFLPKKNIPKFLLRLFFWGGCRILGRHTYQQPALLGTLQVLFGAQLNREVKSRTHLWGTVDGSEILTSWPWLPVFFGGWKTSYQLWDYVYNQPKWIFRIPPRTSIKKAILLKWKKTSISQWWGCQVDVDVAGNQRVTASLPTWRRQVCSTTPWWSTSWVIMVPVRKVFMAPLMSCSRRTPCPIRPSSRSRWLGERWVQRLGGWYLFFGWKSAGQKQPQLVHFRAHNLWERLLKLDRWKMI